MTLTVTFKCPFQHGPHTRNRTQLFLWRRAQWIPDFPFLDAVLRSAVAQDDGGLGHTAQAVESTSAVGECNGNSVTHEVSGSVFDIVFDSPAEVTQDFFLFICFHLAFAALASIFVARVVQPLSLPFNRRVEYDIVNWSALHLVGQSAKKRPSSGDCTEN